MNNGRKPGEAAREANKPVDGAPSSWNLGTFSQTNPLHSVMVSKLQERAVSIFIMN